MWGINKIGGAFKRDPVFVSTSAESMMVALWYSGKDTHEIARQLGFHESDVYNRLPLLRARHRQMHLGPRHVD